MQLKQHKCGCENNDCKADPNEVTTPNTVPIYTMDSIPGHTIPSVAYQDLGEFLFQYYERVNTVVNAIIKVSDPSGSICKPDS